MISAHNPAEERSSAQLTNKVIKVLSAYGSLYKTFGENIILLINREGEILARAHFCVLENFPLISAHSQSNRRDVSAVADTQVTVFDIHYSQHL